MVVFLANRANLQSRRLHDRIRNRLSTEFTAVRQVRADPRDPGPYRVIGAVSLEQFLGDTEYPATTGRIEIGFQLQTDDSFEYYWINWIEPERGLLVGWHQDETHNDLGPVHLQVNDGTTTVVHEPARFIDAHPLDVVEQRLGELHEAVVAVQWEEGRAVGLDRSASVVDRD